MKRKWYMFIVLCCFIATMLTINARVRNLDDEANKCNHEIVTTHVNHDDILALVAEIDRAQSKWFEFLENYGFVGFISNRTDDVEMDFRLNELLNYDEINYTVMPVSIYWDTPCTHDEGHGWASRGMVTITLGEYGWNYKLYYMWCVHCPGRYARPLVETRNLK